jgi:hypothetical protein
VDSKLLLLMPPIATLALVLFIAPSAVAPVPSGEGKEAVLGIKSSSHPGLQKPSSKNDHTKHSSSVISNKIIDIKLPPMHEGLSLSTVPQLRKLAEYEKAAGGAVANRLMIFTDIPATAAQSEAAGSDMAATLKEFKRFKINALVIMEPVINGKAVNFKNYRSGSYDSLIGSYFQSIKSHGINDSALGMWVYFPEANLPEWGPVDTANYAANVTRSVKLQKKYFPNSQSSILLDAMSYPAGSTSWDDGEYVSLSPFIKDIPKGLLDSIGIQGFPWVPPANQQGWPNLEAQTFLSSKIAQSAASKMGTKNIWLNTGTFAKAYCGNKSQTVVMSNSQRQKILQGIEAEAKKLMVSGNHVSVNIFSEDKSRVAEGIDWSYKSPSAKTVLTSFIKRLKSSGINFWLFDV